MGFTSLAPQATLGGMFSSLIKAISQLTDPRFRRTLFLGLGATLLLYILLYALTGWAMTAFSLFEAGWANTLTDILGGLAVLIVSLMMFPSIAVLTLGFLLDGIAQAVEEKYYPQLPPPRDQPSGEIIWGALRFSAVTVAVNLLALPIYLALLIVGLGIGLYYIVNGYLLSREYFELAAWRRMPPPEAEAMRRAHGGRLWLTGIILAILSSLPVINLIAPLIGAATMVHEVERLRHLRNRTSAP